MKKIGFLFIVMLIAFSCKKSDKDEPDLILLNVQFTSIYPIENIQIGVFQGWVDPSQNDLKADSKNFFKVADGNSTKLSKKLKPGPYTILIYYADKFALYVEKVNLQTQAIDVNKSFENEAVIKGVFNNIIYNLKEPIYAGMAVDDNSAMQSIKVGEQLMLKGEQIPYPFNLQINTPGTYRVNCDAKWTNGKNTSVNYEIKVLSKSGIKDVWNAVNEDYLNQSCFNTKSFTSVREDVKIGNQIINKTTIIEGFTGVYLFNFKNHILSSIKINHGNLNTDGSLSINNIVEEISKVYGIPNISNDQYTFISAPFTIKTLREGNNINTYITQ